MYYDALFRDNIRPTSFEFFKCMCAAYHSNLRNMTTKQRDAGYGFLLQAYMDLSEDHYMTSAEIALKLMSRAKHQADFEDIIETKQKE